MIGHFAFLDLPTVRGFVEYSETYINHVRVTLELWTHELGKPTSGHRVLESAPKYTHSHMEFTSVPVLSVSECREGRC